MAFFEQKILKTSEFPFEVFIADNLKENISVEDHWHECFEIMYNITGEALHTVNNRKISAKAGDIVFVRSGDIHSTVCISGSNTTIFVIKFMPDIIENYNCISNSKYMAAFLNNNSRTVSAISGSTKAQTEELMNDILKEYQEKQKGYEMYIKAYIFALAGLFVRENVIAVPDVYDGPAMDSFGAVIDYIENNYNKDISLADISDMLNMNYSYTSRYFKKITGNTFKQYLDYIRVSEADKLIFSSKKSLSKIAAECGFMSPQSFSRTYKRIKGYSAKVKKC